MEFQLEPLTEAGRRFVDLAEQHAADFADDAAEHDREGRFPADAVEAMKASGFSAGPIPEEFGGMGVASLHDLMVAVSRLGRADGSIAIAIHMHLVTCSIVEPAAALGVGARRRGDGDRTRRVHGRPRWRRDRARQRHRVGNRPPPSAYRGDTGRRRLASRRPEDLRHDVGGRGRDDSDVPAKARGRHMGHGPRHRVPRHARSNDPRQLERARHARVRQSRHRLRELRPDRRAVHGPRRLGHVDPRRSRSSQRRATSGCSARSSASRKLRAITSRRCSRSARSNRQGR